MAWTLTATQTQPPPDTILRLFASPDGETWQEIEPIASHTADLLSLLRRMPPATRIDPDTGEMREGEGMSYD
jgi:hypothetical protein